MDRTDWISSNQLDTFIEKLSDYLKKHTRNRMVVTDTSFYLFLKQYVFVRSSMAEHREWWLRVFSRNQNIFQSSLDLLDQILIPVNLTSDDEPTGTHWILAIIAPRKRRIFIGDSFCNNANEAHREAVNVLLQFIEIYSQVFQLPRLSAVETHVERIDPEAFLLSTGGGDALPLWQLCMIKIKDLQQDDSNCGIYLLAMLCLASIDPQDKVPKNIRLLRPIGELRSFFQQYLPPQQLYIKHGSNAQEVALASVPDLSRLFWIQLMQHLSFSFAHIP